VDVLGKFLGRCGGLWGSVKVTKQNAVVIDSWQSERKMLREIQFRNKEFHYLGLRDAVVARIESGKLTEEMPVSAVLDSLDYVELTMELEELGTQNNVPIKSVKDLLWLFKAIDLKTRKE
jgi:hypothetical protein